MSTSQPYHFKEGFHPKCPNPDCQSVNIDISLSEDLYGPANGNYEVIYCRDCHTFLGAHPIVIKNLHTDIKHNEKIKLYSR